MLFADRLVERGARELEGDGLFVQLARKDDLCQPAFEGAHVGARVAREEFEHVRGDHRLAFERLLFEDGDLGLVVGRLDVRDQPAFEAGAEPLFQRGDLLGRDVRGQNDLFVVRFVAVVAAFQIGFIHLAAQLGFFGISQEWNEARFAECEDEFAFHAARFSFLLCGLTGSGRDAGQVFGFFEH